MERLDPFALPLRFTALDQTADGRVRVVDLHRERVVLRRAVHGIKMAVNLPVGAYRGVTMRLEEPSEHDAGAVLLVLEHEDPALSLTLYRAVDCSDVIAEWQSWARTLGLPLLVAETDGRLREPFRRIGGLRVGAPLGRRRRSTPLRRRRITRALRRRLMPGASVVHRGEREIIARN